MINHLSLSRLSSPLRLARPTGVVQGTCLFAPARPRLHTLAGQDGGVGDGHALQVMTPDKQGIDLFDFRRTILAVWRQRNIISSTEYQSIRYFNIY